MQEIPATDLERRKQVKIRLRSDLNIAPQKYEGRTYYVVKDPVSLRYYRFKEQEHFIIRMLDGAHTLDEAQKEFERRFRPDRLPLENLEGFAQQLLTMGLAHNESPQAGKQLFDRRKKRRRNEWLQLFTNILYIKIPVFDPDKTLARMLPYFRWVFTTWFFLLSIGVMLGAVFLVLSHFETFRDKLPSYHEFFNFKTVAYLWVALGAVKVIHEFGHGLSCKTFGGEVHEMGFLFLCLSPCLYCNVSDAWTLPSKWKRIIISFAGIYVELVIAALATFLWWNSPGHPFVNHMSLCLMVVCSVSTVMFNGNPLMRYDGYYILADWIEIPNLRERCNRYLLKLFQEHCLGIEVQPEPYMELSRRILFVIYAVVSYIYRWVVTFGILWFLDQFLKPYKLTSLSHILAGAALGSMIGWPAWRGIKAYNRRGRLPDMKSNRVMITAAVAVAVLLFVFLVPLPVGRVRQVGLVQPQPQAVKKVFVEVPGILEKLHVRDGQVVKEGDPLAEFRSFELEKELAEVNTEAEIRKVRIAALRQQEDQTADQAERTKLGAQLQTADGERRTYLTSARTLRERMERLVLKAPRSGVIMSSPKVDEIGKLWEKEQPAPFCSIGDWNELQALVSVTPADHRLLKDDWDDDRDLPVTIRVHGRGAKTWKGQLAMLQETEAKEVPFQLTSKGGGPLAVKPNPKPNVYVPQNQVFLVAVNFVDPDAAICPGALAQVKIHCRWRTSAWWVWRTMSSTFDLGLL